MREVHLVVVVTLQEFPQSLFWILTALVIYMLRYIKILITRGGDLTLISRRPWVY